MESALVGWLVHIGIGTYRQPGLVQLHAYSLNRHVQTDPASPTPRLQSA